jgi:prefoldin subunit 2
MAGAGLDDATLRELQLAQELKSRSGQLQQSLEELTAQVSEHTRVLEALKDIDPKRNCFRLVGGILVQRNVEAVVPELEQNLSRIVAACKKIDEDRRAKEREANELMKKHASTLEEIGRKKAATAGQ